MGLKGKTALLLASTKGLGFGCAAALVSEGVKVVINGRNESAGREAQKKLGDQALFIPADITKKEERERLFREALEFLESISILVTNADGPSSGNFISKNEEDWQDAFNLVTIPALDVAQRCLPGMVEKGFGRIINISSTSAKEILPGSVLANSLKPALIGAFGTLAREVASTGVTVNNILPGPFNTERIRNYAGKHYREYSEKEAVDKYAESRPMKRIGTIEEFGALCAFLCSLQAAYITGQSILIDGGQVSSLV